MNDRNKPIEYLKKYIGIKQGSKEHKEILSVFNDSKLCKRYKVKVTDPWCATGVSAAFIASNLTDIFPCVECSCENMIKLAKKANIWVEKDNYIPSTGDLILYDWDDDGIGDCKGWSDHVGIVVSITNNKIKVIECNKSKTVGYRTISVNGKYIRGFITPNYKKETKRKTVDELAHEVLAGKWGSGAYRRQALKKAGYDYVAVQRRVNQLLTV